MADEASSRPNGTLPPPMQAALDRAVENLRTRLGKNLHACVLFGSAVRGRVVSGVSDIDLLLVLEESTPEAHAAIAAAIRGPVPIDPIVVGRRGFDRTVRAFAPKFRSIRRHRRVLLGPDPLEGPDTDETVVRFLSEQALRNRALRLANAFIRHGWDGDRYGRYLAESAPGLLVDLSDAVRLEGTAIPADFVERLPVLEGALGEGAGVLRDLLELRARPRRLSASEAADFHSRLYRLVDRALRRIEETWPTPSPA